MSRKWAVEVTPSGLGELTRVQERASIFRTLNWCHWQSVSVRGGRQKFCSARERTKIDTQKEKRLQYFVK